LSVSCLVMAARREICSHRTRIMYCVYRSQGACTSRRLTHTRTRALCVPSSAGDRKTTKRQASGQPYKTRELNPGRPCPEVTANYLWQLSRAVYHEPLCGPFRASSGICTGVCVPCIFVRTTLYMSCVAVCTPTPCFASCLCCVERTMNCGR
jgi:hypothetical protein